MSVLFQVNFELALTSLQNGCIIELIEYAQVISLTSPNHVRAPMISDSWGKFWIALRMVSVVETPVGETPVGVILSPANSTVSLQNWNFDSFVNIPLLAHKVK